MTYDRPIQLSPFFLDKAMRGIFYGRQRFFSFVRGKKIEMKIYLQTVVGIFGLLSGDFDDFLTENLQTL